jgi:hypothetical protein
VADAEVALLGFDDWTGGRSLPAIGTNAGAAVLPFQSWRRFKEAFAPELLEQALRETPGRVTRIVDPFGGSGTTALAAQFLGVHPTTIEVNPYLADLIEAKIATVNLDRAANDLRAVVENVSARSIDRKPIFAGAPTTFIEPGQNGRWVFSRAVAARILAYRSAIEAVADPGIRRLFRVALASSTVPASNVTVSGKGRRYRRGWERKPTSPDLVDRLFCESLTQALYDLRRYSARRCRDYHVLRGDARKLASSVGEHDLAVFSPPYPNSFDYTDVYNVELWSLGYLKGRADNTVLRNATLRSHVQIFRDMSYPDFQSTLLSRTIAALREARSQLWNRQIPEMVGAYMADMATVLRGLAMGLRTSGRIYMVVGDSRYAAVDVGISEILAELAPSLGYRVQRLEPCRSMRASPQQGGRHELVETLIVLQRS